jgi:5'-nucleotidase
MIVLTNDDGIDAPGIVALHQAVTQAYPDRRDQIVTVAPQGQYSGCGHQVTTDTPITLEQRNAQSWAIAGTPADCTRVAIAHLYPQTEWVLAGINAGGNMGSDVYLSGTVAAVREAALHRLGAIAFSHYRQGDRPYDWPRVTQWAAKILPNLMQRPHIPGTYWNVNFPHPRADAPEPEIVFCTSCTQPLPVAFEMQASGLIYRGRYSDRARDPASDVATCLDGNIAITQLQI